jgi:hypothetical protein
MLPIKRLEMLMHRMLFSERKFLNEAGEIAEVAMR